MRILRNLGVAVLIGMIFGPVILLGCLVVAVFLAVNRVE